MTTMTGLLGLADNSNGFGDYASKVVTIAAGESYQYTFVNYNKGAEGADVWENWTVEGRRSDNSHCFDFRADGGFWTWKPDAADADVLNASYTGNTSTDVSADAKVWLADYNGVTVSLTVSRSNDGDVITVAHSATTNTSATYAGTFTCSGFGTGAATIVLTNEDSHQFFNTVIYTNGAGDVEMNVAADHTAGAKWGSNKDYVSTVDAEKEGYNNTSGWAGSAYAKFSYAIPSGYSIESATLNYSKVQYNGSSYSDGIFYMNAGFDLDWANFAGQTNTDLSYSANRTFLLTTASHQGVKGTGKEHNGLTADITTAVRSLFAAAQNYVIIQWTQNSGSADLYGNGSLTKYPSLIIRASAETLFTATFTENNSLAPAVTIYSDSERTVEVGNGSLRDGETYYYTATLVGYNDYQGSFTVNGANPDVNFTMVAKALYAYMVNAVDASSNVLYTIAEGSVYENENVTVPYNAFYLKSDGNLLQANRLSADGKQYQYTFNVDANDKVVTITYNSTSYSNVVFYQEAENIATLTSVNSGNVSVRCSGGSGAYAASDAVITALGPGKYKLSSFAYGNAGTDLSVYAGENLIKTFSTSAATLGITTSDEFTLTATTDIIFKAGGSAGSSPKVLDFFFIQKTAEAATIGATGWTTFASPFALDLSSLSGATAYYAFAVNATSVTMSETTQAAVAAGEGIMLKGTAGEVVSIPVVATGTAISGNLLKGCTAETNLEKNANYYVLVNNGGTAEFQSLEDNGATIPAGKAYLDATSAGARSLDIVFGDADGITAIDNAQSAGNAMFDLSGRRVAKAQKGIYIVNGKKVVK